MAYRSGEQGTKPPKFVSGVTLAPTEEDEKETSGEGINYDNEEFRTSHYFKFIENTSMLEHQLLEQLEEDRLILLPVRVFGYVLLSRKWCTNPFQAYNLEIIVVLTKFSSFEYRSDN